MAAIGGRLTGIEAGRGIAAMLVVLFHTGRHFGKAYGPSALAGLFQFGHAGVDFFFAISGFVILFVHGRDIGRPDRLGHYLWRRFTRIMPPYWIALLVTAMLALAAGHALPAPGKILWSIFLLPSSEEPLLGVAWTLQHELVFYAFFALLIVSRPIGMGALALWLLWIVLTTASVLDPGSVPGNFTRIYNLEFFAGMAAAHWLRHWSVPRPRALLIAGLLLFASAAAADDLGLVEWNEAFGRLAYGLPSCLILLGAAASDRRGPIPVPHLLRTLGAASYSIYLFQFVFIGLLWKLWLAAGLDQRLPMAIGFCLLASGGIAGGVLASRLAERPVMRLIRRERGATRDAVPAQT